MRTKSNLKRELPILIILLLPLLFVILTRDQLKSETVIHWIRPEQIMFWKVLPVLLALNFFIYGLLLVVQRIDPKRKNFELFESSFYKIRFAVSLFMTLISGLFIASDTGMVMDEIRILRILTFSLLAVVGNYIYSVKPNWFIGFRTPWTLDNETVWRKTNQLGAKVMVACSMIGLIVSFFPMKKEATGLVIFFGIILMMILIPVIYSYKLHKKMINNLK